MYKEILPNLLAIGEIFKGKHGRLRDIPMNTLVRSFAGLFFSYYITGLLAVNLGGITNDEESLSQVVDLYLFGVLADDDPARKETHFQAETGRQRARSKPADPHTPTRQEEA
jgi:hypothetical protein